MDQQEFSARLERDLSAVRLGVVWFSSLPDLIDRVRALWRPKREKPDSSSTAKRASSKASIKKKYFPPLGERDFEESPRFEPQRLPALPHVAKAKRPPPWYLGMTNGFTRDVLKIDRKLQGRILEALADITANPLQAKGDTVKPLVGQYEGCWRYRIGDFRLIYSPDRATGDVALLAFAARGSIYED